MQQFFIKYKQAEFNIQHIKSIINYYFFLKILFIYLREIETASERGNTSRGSGRGEAGFPLSKEPDSGLDPRIVGSRPDLKADP